MNERPNGMTLSPVSGKKKEGTAPVRERRQRLGYAKDDKKEG